MPLLRSLVVSLLFAPVVAAADWPQWLGPTRDGASPEIIRPWTTPPKVLWRQPVAEGHSSPVVAGGKVYLLTKVADKSEEELSAYDAEGGKLVWHTAYPRDPAFKSLFGNGPRATPAVADGKVFTYGIT